MPLPITRRGFAKTSVAAVVGLGSLATLARYSPASAEEAKLLPNDVRLTPDIEPLVRILRERRPEHPVLDVAYADLARDPLATMMSLYDGLGLEPGPGAFAAVESYVCDHPRREFGSHSYDVSEYGLTDAAVRERFRGYTDRYGVEPETLGH